MFAYLLRCKKEGFSFLDLKGVINFITKMKTKCTQA